MWNSPTNITIQSGDSDLTYFWSPTPMVGGKFILSGNYCVLYMNASYPSPSTQWLSTNASVLYQPPPIIDRRNIY
jgi:hypothetical protein